jgi:hypothetical protein
LKDTLNFLVDGYIHKWWNYFYNPIINSEINDGPLADTLPAQEGKGFQDYSTITVEITIKVENKFISSNAENIQWLYLTTDVKFSQTLSGTNGRDPRILTRSGQFLTDHGWY